MAVHIDTLPKMRGVKVVSIDTEIRGIPEGKLHRPVGNFYLLSCSTGEDTYVATTPQWAEKILWAVDGVKHVMHNGIFDVRQIRRFTEYGDRSVEQYADTLLYAKVKENGLHDSFSLAALCGRYFGVRLEKSSRQDIVNYVGEVKKSHINYAAKDAEMTLRVYKKLVELYPDVEGSYLWKEIEHPLMWAILDFAPFDMDEAEWKKLAISAGELAVEEKQKINYNARSPKQVKEALLAAGIKLPNTKKDTLKKFANIPAVSAILAVRDSEKKAGDFGLDYLESYTENGQIYGSFKQIGAVTGRMSASDPNLQQVPNAKPYRKCFTVGSTEALIIADFNAQEPRITAQLSGDEHLLHLFRIGEDVHLAAAKVVFPKGNFADPDTKKELRTRAKPIGLGLVYGLTSYGLAKKINESKEVAQTYYNLYMNHYQGVVAYLQRIRDYAKEYGHVTTIAGRECWMNPYSWNRDNTASNYPIQGSAADLIKRSIVLVHRECKRLGIQMVIIAPIHDEIVARCKKKDAKRVAALIKKSMETAFRELCPNVGTLHLVEPVVGKTWADK